MFLIADTHASRRASVAIPLVVRTLIDLTYFGNWIPGRAATLNFFSRKALEIRIRDEPKVPGRTWQVILYHEQDEDTVHLRRDGGLSYASMCTRTEWDTDVFTIVIERAAYNNVNETLSRRIQKFLWLLPPGCASSAFPFYMMQAYDTGCSVTGAI